MFQNLRPHEAYSNTSSPWINRVPSSWRLERLKSLLRERSAKGYAGEPLLAATQSHGVILKSSYGTRTVTATKDLHLLKLVEVGDFVISLRSFQGGIERCHHRGIISPAYTILATKDDLYRDYLTFLFKAQPFVSALTLAVTGIREGQNIDYPRLSTELFPVPPADEQAAIVKYLAHATARIDKAIATKRRLVSLLEEQQHGRIDVALGGGASAWPTRRLKTLVQCVDQGLSPQAENRPPELNEWGVLKSGVVNGGVYRDDQIKRLPPDFVVPLELAVSDGDLLVSRASGSPNLVGSAAVVCGISHRAILSDKIFRLRLRDEVGVEFMALAMNARSYREQVLQAISGAEGLANNLPLSSLLRFTFVIPPWQVQEDALAKIAAASKASQTTRRRAEQEIALLKEFRARLIADVVTGQFDVRSIAASLPDVDPTIAWGSTDVGDESEHLELDEALSAEAAAADEED